MRTKEEIAAYKHQYYLEHQEKIKLQNLCNYHLYVDKKQRAIAQRKRYKKKRAEMQAYNKYYQRVYRAKHHKELVAYRRRYYQKNKARIRVLQQEYRRRKNNERT